MTDNMFQKNALLTDKEVAKILGGMSRASVWANVKKGIIPPPIKLGGITRFLMSDIQEVIDRAKQRRNFETQASDLA